MINIGPSWGDLGSFAWRGAKAAGRGALGAAKKAAGYNYQPPRFTKASGAGFTQAPFSNKTQGFNLKEHFKQNSFMGYHSQFIRDKFKGAKTTYRGMKSGPTGFGGMMTGIAGAGMGSAAFAGSMFDKFTFGDKLDAFTMYATASGAMERVEAYNDNPQDHSSRLHAALGAVSQEGLDTFLMMGMTKGPIGASLALLSSSFGDISGVGANAMLERGLGKMADQMESDQYGKKRVSQNEQTARATSDQMSLILQTGYAGNEMINPQSFSARRRGLLGNEAMLMHN